MDMAYATIMVHLEWDGEVDGRAKLAAKLADQFQSELIGINAWMPRPRAIIDSDLAASEFRYMEGETQKIVKKFKTKVGVDGRKVSLRSFRQYPTECIAREIRAADLLVISREFGVNDPYLYPDTAALVLKVGRPVLAVPPGTTTLSGGRVVVGQIMEKH
jgi:nucleotide-binding universal stress UspA family protein